VRFISLFLREVFFRAAIYDFRINFFPFLSVGLILLTNSRLKREIMCQSQLVPASRLCMPHLGMIAGISTKSIKDNVSSGRVFTTRQVRKNYINKSLTCTRLLIKSQTGHTKCCIQICTVKVFTLDCFLHR
jgi:hypothetical protein